MEKNVQKKNKHLKLKEYLHCQKEQNYRNPFWKRIFKSTTFNFVFWGYLVKYTNKKTMKCQFLWEGVVGVGGGFNVLSKA